MSQHTLVEEAFSSEMYKAMSTLLHILGDRSTAAEKISCICDERNNPPSVLSRHAVVGHFYVTVCGNTFYADRSFPFVSTMKLWDSSDPIPFYQFQARMEEEANRLFHKLRSEK
jgi:hypothetical protein